MTEKLPFQTQQPIFSKVGSISELSHMDSEERRKYFDSLNRYRTSLAVMQNEREEGIEIGREEGREEKAIEIATNLKSLGFEIDEIAQITGLSISEIEGL